MTSNRHLRYPIALMKINWTASEKAFGESVGYEKRKCERRDRLIQFLCGS